MSIQYEKSGASGPLCGGKCAQGDMPRVHSEQLFCGGRRLLIEHGGEQYCLRLTRNDRLILNKL